MIPHKYLVILLGLFISGRATIIDLVAAWISILGFDYKVPQLFLLINRVQLIAICLALFHNVGRLKEYVVLLI